jgi:ferredoxin
MATTDANPPMPEFRDDYVLQEVDADYLAKAVKPKQFIHIDQSECIMCEGCVDICPWKCIHMVRPTAIEEAVSPASTPRTTWSSSSTTTSAPGAPCASTGARRASSSWARWVIRPPAATPTSARTRTATATGCGSADGRARAHRRDSTHHRRSD